jgi:hypothetical protein
MRKRAVDVLEQARADAGNIDDVHAMLAAAYARAGRLTEARRAAGEAIRLNPSLCVEFYRVSLSHFRMAMRYRA